MEKRFANLTALAHFYRTKGKHTPFCVAVRSMADACAARTDLQMVGKLLEAYRSLWEFKSVLPAETYSFTRGGTCSNAVIFYARATKIRNGARGAVELAAHLPGELLGDHDHIQNLRDEAIAHFGSGKRTGSDRWSNGAVVAHFSSKTFRVKYHSEHALSETAVVERLERLMPVANQAIFDECMHRGDVLSELLQRLLRENTSFAKRVFETNFDPEVFYVDAGDFSKTAFSGDGLLVNRNGPSAPGHAIRYPRDTMTRSKPRE